MSCVVAVCVAGVLHAVPSAVMLISRARPCELGAVSLLEASASRSVERMAFLVVDRARRVRHREVIVVGRLVAATQTSHGFRMPRGPWELSWTLLE